MQTKMINVLQSINRVTEKFIEVEITDTKIEEFANKVKAKDLKVSEIALAKYDWSLEQLIELVFTFNVIN